MEIQKEMYSSAQVYELQRLSDTRWACRYTACKAVRDRLPALMQLLSDLADGCNAKRAVEAKALLNALDCQFVLMLLFTRPNTIFIYYVAIYRNKLFGRH